MTSAALTAMVRLVAAFVVLPSVVSAEEVVIEDRLENPTSTNGRGAVISLIRGGTYGATVSKIHTPSKVRLSKIEGIGIPYNPSGPVAIDAYGFKAAIHSNEFQATNTSLNGDVLPLTALPAPFVQAFGSDSRGYPSYYVIFDLSTLPNSVILDGNKDYWITVLGVSGTDWDWSESSQAGISDTWTVDDVFIFSWTSFGLPTGRASLKFIGETLPLPGDYDRDDDVDGADFLQWQREFGSMLPRYDGSDGNGDGTVDAADYVVWRDNFGAGASNASQVAVPEPNALSVLGCVAALGLQTLRVSKRKRPPREVTASA